MLKKIITSLLIIISVFFIADITNAANCNYNGGSISDNLDSCLSNSDLVNSAGDTSIENDFKSKILDWTQRIGGFLGLIAVGAIVYAGFMMTISTGEEEKIKKAKDIIKWALLGFLGIVLAGSIITIVVNFMYSL